jgi:hypothetical protein
VEIKALHNANNTPILSSRKWLNVDLRQFALHLRISKLHVQNFLHGELQFERRFSFLFSNLWRMFGVHCCHSFILKPLTMYRRSLLSQFYSQTSDVCAGVHCCHIFILKPLTYVPALCEFDIMWIQTIALSAKEVCVKGQLRYNSWICMRSVNASAIPYIYFYGEI